MSDGSPGLLGAGVVRFTAALLVLLGSVAGGWWLIGDLTESAVTNPEYLVSPPNWSPVVERTVGVGGWCVAFLSAVYLLVGPAGRYSGSRHRRPFVLVVLVILAGVFVALVLRLATIGASGANMAGLSIIFGGPLALLAAIGLMVALTRALGDTKERV